MIPFSCECGASYAFRDEAGGKMVRCRACGQVHEVPLLSASAPGEGVASPPVSAFVGDSIDAAPPQAERLPDPTRHAWSNPPLAGLGDDPLPLARDILEALLFFRSGWNLMIWLTLAATLGVATALTHAFLFFRPFQVLLVGLPLAFYMEIVRVSAAGDRSLPDSNNWEGIWASVLGPMLQFLATLLVAFAPAIAGGAILITEGHESIETHPLFIALQAVGVFLWPVLVLGVALGGMTALFRVDLLALTVVRTLPTYTLLVVLMLLLQVGASMAIETAGPAPLTGAARQIEAIGSAFRPIWSDLPGVALAFTISTYASIVTMRLIGLHYLHCRRRFPWSAG